MGFGRHDLAILADMKRQSLIPDRGAIVEIGAQQLNNSFLEARADIEAFGRLFGVTEPMSLPAAQRVRRTAGGTEILDAEAPHSREFWNWLGFRYAAVDIDGSPDAIPLDLNYDEVPAALKGRHHLVTNYGTTEHVANQLNAFKIIHDLTAVGGLMTHNLPSQGNLVHGLFNYNPKFFWMIARSNSYKICLMDYCMEVQGHPVPSQIADFVRQYRPNISTRLEGCRTSDAGIDVVLQKVVDMPFIPPIDVDTGARTDNQVLRERYWTVFNPSKLVSLMVRQRPIPLSGLAVVTEAFGKAVAKQLCRRLLRPT